MIYEVAIAGKVHKVELVRAGSGWHCQLDGRNVPLDVSAVQTGVFSLLIDGKSYEVKQEITPTETSIVIGNERLPVTVRDPRSLRSRRSSETGEEGVKRVIAPMPGKVVRILARAGAAVEAGQGVVVIEAMKMQNELKAPKNGVVKKINVAEGAAVDAGQALAEVE